MANLIIDNSHLAAQDVSNLSEFSNTTVLLIDNYDSFTWNIYEYIIQQGVKDCKVVRNDKISVAEIEEMNPDIIVISPGPGHPITDSGICCDVINFFKGRTPIFGVCMGQECIIQLFGGEIVYAGEIVHGKTSTIKHDQLGCFKGISQSVAVTRYHSLAAEKSKIPDCFDITALTEESQVIMGVRHKEFVIEGVQFHPESILTEQGHLMIRNMLRYKGFGTWDEFYKGKQDLRESTPSLESIINRTTVKESILEKIFAKRRQDYESIQQIPGLSKEDLEITYKLNNKNYERINLYNKLNESNDKYHVFSEIKRASPSKGDINVAKSVLLQAKSYADSKATVISCLTESHWFKGDLHDFRNIADFLKLNYSAGERPLLLRKDFIFSEYQILESVLAGADTVLLIVKMLTDDQLLQLYKYCISLNIEPLVEVANMDELKNLLKLIPTVKCIGINNRDLHTFNVDMNISIEISNYLNSKYELSPEQRPLIITLSGILNAQDADVFKFKDSCIKGFLVGEGLMRTDNVSKFISDLKHE
ncbi:hypothetical protein QEN19_003908 [Hanseniaspora menglaensis]